MGVWFSLFRRDLKSMTEFPRFEILLGVFGFLFVILSLVSRVDPWTERFFNEAEFIPAVNRNFSYFLLSFVYLLPSLVVSEVIIYEKATLESLSGQVSKLKIFTSKLLASYLVTSATLTPLFTLSILLGASMNGIQVDTQIVYSYFIASQLLCIILTSITTLVSHASPDDLIAMLILGCITVGWSIIITGIAAVTGLQWLNIYSYIETVLQLAHLLMSPNGPFLEFTKAQILRATGVQLVASATCLVIAYKLYTGKTVREAVQ